FALHPAYPNPFNPSTTIRFDLPEALKVSLKVYNLRGQVVATVIDGFRDAGYHEVSFNAENLSSGIYFFRLDAGKFSDQGKLVLLK
ncbi:T9SS type A sorting domain-containing protein, partial [bacterium]|nr:T9SS type A sorting domain-containing protein [bacterium]